MHSTVHYGSTSPVYNCNFISQQTNASLTPNSLSQWHKYAMLWTDHSISFYFDDIQWAR